MRDFIEHFLVLKRNLIPFTKMLSGLLETIDWNNWLKQSFRNLEIGSLKMTLFLSIQNTWIKTEIGYCIWVCRKDKPLSVSQNTSRLGRKNWFKIMTKTTIFVKSITMLYYFNSNILFVWMILMLNRWFLDLTFWNFCTILYCSVSFIGSTTYTIKFLSQLFRGHWNMRAFKWFCKLKKFSISCKFTFWNDHTP